MSEPDLAIERQIPARTHAVGPGWAPLLAQLHNDLVGLAPDYQLDRIGTEFGRLRLDVADRFDAAGEFDGAFADASGAVIDAAVLASQETCEECGADGRSRLRGDEHGTFIRTLCDKCRSTRQRQPDEYRIQVP